ncbi:MAG: DUF971 domain-containing protein [Nitrospirae bacterium]|nr:DUF971 domain-containing protein [Nitrospirota bacterium]
MFEVRPVEIEKREDGSIRVAWSNGHEGIYPAAYLRENCHCASCIEEWTGRKMIEPEAIPNDIRPLRISAVGQYAIHIEWSDGHSTGIYAFDLLRSLCPCPSCVSERAARLPDGPQRP